jgi:hypothetical protein
LQLKNEIGTKINKIMLTHLQLQVVASSNYN